MVYAKSVASTFFAPAIKATVFPLIVNFAESGSTIDSPLSEARKVNELMQLTLHTPSMEILSPAQSLSI
jgi:hypothetical protein